MDKKYINLNPEENLELLDMLLKVVHRGDLAGDHTGVWEVILEKFPQQIKYVEAYRNRRSMELTDTVLMDGVL